MEEIGLTFCPTGDCGINKATALAAVTLAVGEAIYNDYKDLVVRAANGDAEAVGALTFEAALFLIPGDEARFSKNIRRISPKDVRFTQPTASQNFSSKGTINELIDALREGRITPDEIPIIRVVEKDGKIYTLDNRRLSAFDAADVESIPVEVLSLDDPAVAREFKNKFNPINDGENIVITKDRKGRKPAEKLLREKGKIN